MSDNKKELSERDICSRYITPSIEASGWKKTQIREEFTLTPGRIVVHGNMASRNTNPKKKYGPRRADYVLSTESNIQLVVVEAKKNTFSIGHGMQQALTYAESLDVPFAISSNGDGFLFHDRTGLTQPVERELTLSEFPSCEELWKLYKQWKNIESPELLKLIEEPYYSDNTGKSPYYYQKVAVDRTIEAVGRGQDKILLVMATGTGKTYTAFQIIHRLRSAKKVKRVLFLADRNILVDQTMLQDFAPFGEHMHKIGNREVKLVYDIYMSLYHAVTGKEDWKKIYRQFPKDFFDLIVIDECHRGSAKEDSAWRDILTYFDSATHLGLTATPVETKEASSSTYFGEAIYTYTLKQGIEDGFLAPYKVIRVVSDVDALGFIPEKGQKDKNGELITERQYNTKDFDRNMILTKRTQYVATKVWDYLRQTDPMAKTIVFCDDQDHAERMRSALVKLIPAAASNRKYVMRITGDDKEGKDQLSYFIDNDEPFPVIATTSKLLTTGVDAKTCKLIVLDQSINSMTEFKQIIGRGTRLKEDYNKFFFTIMDFKNATRLFADPKFDGDPVVVYEPKDGDPIVPPGDGIDQPGGNDDFSNNNDGSSNNDDSADDDSSNTKKRVKFVVDNLDVSDGSYREQFLDEDGNLFTAEFKDHLKAKLKKELTHEFSSLKEFLRRWSETERKQAILTELESQAITLEILQQAVPNSSNLDIFDLIAHIAFDQEPLTRKERANKVKKRNYFGKYGKEARLVIDGLLDKFSSNGISDIEDPQILELPPFSSLGTKTHIRRNIFGGTDKYSSVVTELENALYDDVG